MCVRGCRLGRVMRCLPCNCAASFYRSPLGASNSSTNHALPSLPACSTNNTNSLTSLLKPLLPPLLPILPIDPVHLLFYPPQISLQLHLAAQTPLRWKVQYNFPDGNDASTRSETSSPIASSISAGENASVLPRMVRGWKRKQGRVFGLARNECNGGGHDLE